MESSMKQNVLKSFFITVFILLFGNFAFSSSVFFSPKIELKNYKIKEYVFDGNHKLSQLDWNVKNQINVGLKSDFYIDRLFVGFDFSLGLYNFDGFMEDRDWENYNKPNITTKYSFHDLVVSEDLDFSFQFGFNFPFENIRTLEKIFLEFNFKNSLLLGNNGWYDYSDLETPGTVISYNPTIISFILNFTGKYQLLNNLYLNLETGFGLSSFGICTDNHVLTNTKFVDKVKGSLALKQNIYFSFDISDYNAIIFGGKLENIPIIKGPTFINGYSSNGIGGFSSFSYNFYLSYRIRML